MEKKSKTLFLHLQLIFGGRRPFLATVAARVALVHCVTTELSTVIAKVGVTRGAVVALAATSVNIITAATAVLEWLETAFALPLLFFGAPTKTIVLVLLCH